MGQMRAVIEKRIQQDVLPALETGMSENFPSGLVFQVDETFYTALAGSGKRSQVNIRYTDSG